MATAQRENLHRVRTSIAPLVLAFCAERLRTNPIFCVNELHQYVAARAPIAAPSADRILRLLRREKQISYTVISRSQSKYELRQPGMLF